MFSWILDITEPTRRQISMNQLTRVPARSKRSRKNKKKAPSIDPSRHFLTKISRRGNLRFYSNTDIALLGDPGAIWLAHGQMKNFVEIFENFFLTPGKFSTSPYFGLLGSEVFGALWCHFCGELTNLPFSSSADVFCFLKLIQYKDSKPFFNIFL